MANLPGMMADVYFGDVEKPLPDWRARVQDDDGDEDVPLTADERKALVGILGFDPDEMEDEEEEPAAKPVRHARQDEPPDDFEARYGPAIGRIQARSLAQHYADLWNTHGEDVSESDLQQAGAELADSDWVLHYSPALAKWTVLPAGDFHEGPRQYAKGGPERAPKGGVHIAGRFYRGGQWIPSSEVAKETPEVRAKIAAAKEENRTKRSGRGPVDVGKLKESLAPHTGRQLTELQAAEARQSFNALRGHHGDLTLHRVEELAQQTQAALDKIDPQRPLAEHLREKLGQRLKGYEHMMEWAGEHGITGKPGESGEGKPATSPEPEPESEPVMRTDVSTITRSDDRMSNSGYHRSGKPTWWARVGSGDGAKFLDIPKIRGDSYFSAKLDVPPGTTVHIGVGRGSDGIRETIVTDSVPDDRPIQEDVADLAEAESTTSTVTRSDSRMSNSGYHRSGKPTWWARVGTGDDARFLDIPKIRGDQYFSGKLDVPPGTKVFLGVGPAGRDGIRETVVTDPLPKPADVNEPKTSEEKPASQPPADSLASIAVGELGDVDGFKVRRQGEGQYRLETDKGHVTGDAATIRAEIGRQKSAEGSRSKDEALSRASGYDEPNYFTDAHRAEKDARAFEALPSGTRVVSLEAETHGRLGTVEKIQEDGKTVAKVKLDGQPGYASNYAEPLDPKLSWRLSEEAKAQREADRPKQGGLFEQPQEAVTEGKPTVNLADPQAMADAVHAAGKTLSDHFGKPPDPTAGSWSSRKVLIGQLYDAMKPQLGGVSLDEFKKALFDAHKAGTLSMHRTDMPQFVPKDQWESYKQSEIAHLNATFHNVDVNSPQAQKGMKPLAATAPPTAAKPAPFVNPQQKAAYDLALRTSAAPGAHANILKSIAYKAKDGGVLPEQAVEDLVAKGVDFAAAKSGVRAAYELPKGWQPGNVAPATPVATPAPAQPLVSRQPTPEPNQSAAGRVAPDMTTQREQEFEDRLRSPTPESIAAANRTEEAATKRRLDAAIEKSRAELAARNAERAKAKPWTPAP